MSILAFKAASDYILPLLTVIIIIHGALKGVKVFDTFVDGAHKGLKTVLNLVSPLTALTAGVSMLKASGALSFLCSAVSPLAAVFGIPPEILPLCVLSPISGSGSVTVLESILADCGPDSFAGRCASVISGSTETTFYALTVYYGAAGVKNTRYTLPCSVCADLISYIASPIAVRLFLY